MAGTEMLILADLKEMEVNVDVNENDIVRVHNGDTANIEVDAYLGKKFKGVVTEVASSANITGASAEQVTNFVVKIRILRESYSALVDTLHPDRNVFHPGMSATVDIMTRKIQGAISVPIQSVTTRDTTSQNGLSEGGKTGSGDASGAAPAADEKKEVECVFVMVNGKVELRPVVTGIQDNTYIQVVNGLKAGEKVVSGPYSAISRTLKAEDEVETVSKEELYNGRGK
jgi:HlyD family secretion protein